MVNHASGASAQSTRQLSVERSNFEEARFGVRTARAFIEDVADIEQLDAFCRRDRTRLLIVRCPAPALNSVQALEARGARLMDTLMFFERGIELDSIPARSDKVHIRQAGATDGPCVGDVAREAFANFFGHYHADPLLDGAKCEEGYVEWAERSVLVAKGAGAVFLAEDDSGAVGFCTVRRNSADESEGVLFGVRPRAQGRGICRGLMIEAMRWSADAGARRTVVPTQITNIASQKVWLRLGFEPGRALYTLHQWFD